MKLKGKDILLLILYAKGTSGKVAEPILGTTRLTKSMFLFEEEFKSKFISDTLTIDDMPEFIAWNYGPWSKELIDNIEFFVGINFIKTEKDSSSKDVSLAETEEANEMDQQVVWKEFPQAQEDQNEDLYAQKKYCLTDTGIKYVESKILPSISEAQIKLISDFKTQINRISLFSLLRYVYRNYSKKEKDWTKNSVIRDNIL